MARSDSRDDASKDSNTDVESDLGSAFVTAHASEETPLLPTDLPPDIVPDKRFQRIVIAMCTVLVIIIETGQFLREPPTQAIMEDIICRHQFPDHHVRMPFAQSHQCKDTQVQKALAMVRSWSMTVESLFPLLVQVPYGIVADKYGRRLVLFLSMLGISLNTAWITIALSFPGTFSVWASLWGRIAYLIGGGGPMAVAMIWTIVSDVVPVAERTMAFYTIQAVGLILNVVMNPSAAFLMSLDPWIPVWIGLGAQVIGTFFTLLIPETLRFRQAADDRRRRDQPAEPIEAQLLDDANAKLSTGGSVKRAWIVAKNDMGHMLRFIFASRSIMTLVAAYSLFYPVRLAYLAYLLQYMTDRFDWEWSKATYLSTVGSVTSVVVLLVVMPASGALLTRRYKLGSLARDLFLSRASIVFAVIGAVCVSFASVPWLLIVALVINSFSIGFSTQCRALLNAVVEPHTVGTLNTAIATTETVMGLLGAPVMGWLFSRGFDLGGQWVGLPYMVTAVMTSVILVIVFLFRIPAGVAQVREA